MLNQVTVTGKLKNIKEYSNNKGTIVLGVMTQRNDSGNAVFTIHIAATDPSVQDIVKQLDDARYEHNDDYTSTIKVTGHLSTRFDTTPGKEFSERRAPFTRIIAERVELV